MTHGITLRACIIYIVRKSVKHEGMVYQHSSAGEIVILLIEEASLVVPFAVAVCCQKHHKGILACTRNCQSRYRRAIEKCDIQEKQGCKNQDDGS